VAVEMFSRAGLRDVKSLIAFAQDVLVSDDTADNSKSLMKVVNCPGDVPWTEFRVIQMMGKQVHN
jgi:hypothetical protein